MTLQTYGTFGFLNPGQLAEEPLMLLDFGIEKRQSEKYDFYNDDRDYDGFLFQYTFQGEGVFETEEGSRRLSAGTAFSPVSRKKQVLSACGRTGKPVGISVCAFSGPGSRSYFPENKRQLRPGSYGSRGQLSNTAVAEPARGYDKWPAAAAV
ncbi:MAG: hypothetical protein ACLVAW_30330 [Eisenbergiella massiliensis]